MAQIHFLPMRTDNGNAFRQSLVLLQAVTAGVDLGPRNLHIRAGGRELEALAVELKQQYDELQPLPGAEAPEVVMLLDRMRALAERLEELSGLACTYPA